MNLSQRRAAQETWLSSIKTLISRHLTAARDTQCRNALGPRHYTSRSCLCHKRASGISGTTGMSADMMPSRKILDPSPCLLLMCSLTAAISRFTSCFFVTGQELNRSYLFFAETSCLRPGKMFLLTRPPHPPLPSNWKPQRQILCPPNLRSRDIFHDLLRKPSKKYPSKAQKNTRKANLSHTKENHYKALESRSKTSRKPWKATLSKSL